MGAGSLGRVTASSALVLALLTDAHGSESAATRTARAARTTVADTATQSPWRLELNAGFEYDDTLAVLDIDQRSTEDDVALRLAAKLAYEQPLTAATDVQFDYGYNRTIHEEFSDFDVETHVAAGGVAHDFGAFKAGAAYRFVSSQLGAEPFLDLHQFAPYVSRLFARRYFLRGGYTATRKLFANRPDRDATAQDAELNGYLFLDGLRRYLRVAYKFTAENTNAARFDHHGHTVRVRYAQRFALLGAPAVVKLGIRYEERDYLSLTPALGAERHDRRLAFDGALKVDLAPRWYVLARYRFGHNTSNLAAVDFNENLASLTLGFVY